MPLPALARRLMPCRDLVESWAGSSSLASFDVLVVVHPLVVKRSVLREPIRSEMSVGDDSWPSWKEGTYMQYSVCYRYFGGFTARFSQSSTDSLHPLWRRGSSSFLLNMAPQIAACFPTNRGWATRFQALVAI